MASAARARAYHDRRRADRGAENASAIRRQSSCGRSPSEPRTRPRIRCSALRPPLRSDPQCTAREYSQNTIRLISNRRPEAAFLGTLVPTEPGRITCPRNRGHSRQRKNRLLMHCGQSGNLIKDPGVGLLKSGAEGDGRFPTEHRRDHRIITVPTADALGSREEI